MLYLSNQRIPSRAANGVQTMKMCAALAAIGNDVALYSRPGSERADPFTYYGLPRSFRFVTVDEDAPRGMRTVRHLDVVRRAVRAAAPDVLFGRDLYALALNVRRGVPTILEVHRTLEGRAVEAAVFDWLHRQPAFKRLVVVSRGMRDDYLRRFPALAPELVQVEPGAADPVDQSDATAPLPGSGALKVGYVGHLYPGRGIEVIVDAAARLPDVDFHVVGGTDGDVARWRATPVSPNVTFHGHVSPARVPSYLRAFDVLVAPYQRRVFVDGGAETSAVMSPLKLFEYMSTRRAIVCSDLPVLREVLDDGVAVLVPPDDAGAWAAAIDGLRDAARREAVATAAHARFLERHTWQSRAARVCAAYGARRGSG